MKFNRFCEILRGSDRLTDPLGSKERGSPDAQSLFGNLVNASEEPRLTGRASSQSAYDQYVKLDSRHTLTCRVASAKSTTRVRLPKPVPLSLKAI
jgi:hypothetical protein